MVWIGDPMEGQAPRCGLLGCRQGLRHQRQSDYPRSGAPERVDKSPCQAVRPGEMRRRLVIFRKAPGSSVKANPIRPAPWVSVSTLGIDTGPGDEVRCRGGD